MMITEPVGFLNGWIHTREREKKKMDLGVILDPRTHTLFDMVTFATSFYVKNMVKISGPGTMK